MITTLQARQHGKSTVMKELAELYLNAGKTVYCCSPDGCTKRIRRKGLTLIINCAVKHEHL